MVTFFVGGMGSESVTMDQLMAAVRLGAALKSQRSIEPVVTVASSLLAAEVPVLTCNGIHILPIKRTLRRARVRLDVAAMMFHRWQVAQEAPIVPVHCVLCVSAERCRDLCCRQTNRLRGR